MNTRRSWLPAGFGALLLSLASWALMQAPPAGGSLAGIVPSGPVLVLEAQDFSRLLADWNNSPEKQQWLAGANYQMFTRSRLYYRLSEAHNEFTAAAGFSPGMPLLESIAGTESALALYDIGELRFLYITRLGSARALENMLWQSRANFEPRNAAGREYYLRTDAQSGRQAAFAATGEFLLLATAEEPLAQALTLLAGQGGAAVANDAWHHDAVEAAAQSAGQASAGRGELRLTLNMEALARSPHFRSYWIQRNVSELRQYRAAVIDLHRERGAMRESRVLLRAADFEAPAAPENREQALAQVLRLAPPQAGLYRAWTAPQPAQVIELLRQKLLDPSAGASARSDSAPQVVLGGGTVGSQAALETRIDEPPPTVSTGRFVSEALENLFAQNAVAAMLQTESSRPGVEGVFVNSDAAVVLFGASAWDLPDALESLAGSIQGRLTVSGLGAGWTQRPLGAQTAYALDGVAPLLAAGQGRYLLIANSAAALQALQARMSQPVGPPGATFAAGLRHVQERGNYQKQMAHLDFLQGAQTFGNEQREPYFFSESIASLSETLSRVESVSRRVEDRGASVLDIVTYQLQP
jgi:hypothetical protein